MSTLQHMLLLRNKKNIDTLLRDNWCLNRHIDLDKRGYQANSFLISRQKHMLWVLIRSASVR